MSEYKLTYFGVRGRGEPIRMLLTLAGKKFDDVKVGHLEWPTMKTNTPLGFLPILTTKDGELCNTVAICNYLASKFGYQPESEWYRAQSESLMIAANDLSQFISVNVYIYTVYKAMPEPEDMKEKLQAARDEITKKYEFFSKTAKPGAKYLFGDKMTVADILLFTVTDSINCQFPEVRTTNNWTSNWLTAMESDEKFSNYLQNREPSHYGV